MGPVASCPDLSSWRAWVAAGLHCGHRGIGGSLRCQLIITIIIRRICIFSSLFSSCHPLLLLLLFLLMMLLLLSLLLFISVIPFISHTHTHTYHQYCICLFVFSFKLAHKLLVFVSLIFAAFFAQFSFCPVCVPVCKIKN